MKAVLTTPLKTAILSTTSPHPALSPKNSSSILVRTSCVALNPADWKAVSRGVAQPNSLVGCDYSGTVIEVGSKVTKPFKPGDRICGFVHGNNALNSSEGAFAEYILVEGDLQIKTPETLSDEEAATLGVGITTVGQGLYQSLRMTLPSPESEPSPASPADPEKVVLIYGGSSATGTLAIQFAKLSGYHVITTCSPRNFDLVRRYGADAVYDYNDPNAPAKIKEYTGDALRLVFDTISLEQSVQFCEAAISSSGGEYSALLSTKSHREDVNSRFTLGYTAFGVEKVLGKLRLPASAEDRKYAEMFWELARELFERKRLRTHPVSVRPGGLQGVLEGMQYMKEGKLSAAKLVYRVAETP